MRYTVINRKKLCSDFRRQSKQLSQEEHVPWIVKVESVTIGFEVKGNESKGRSSSFHRITSERHSKRNLGWKRTIGRKIVIVSRMVGVVSILWEDRSLTFDHQNEHGYHVEVVMFDHICQRRLFEHEAR